jgi:hypothetical protein
VPLGRADFDAAPKQIGSVLDEEEPEASLVPSTVATALEL